MNTCVVGGGIAGALTAHELTRRGFSVRILDAEAPGAATPASAGILFRVVDWSETGVWHELSQYGHQAWPKLCAGQESEMGFERRGLLLVDHAAKPAARWAAAHNMAYEVLTPRESRSRYPQLAPLERDAVLLPEVAQIDPRKFMQTFRVRLQEEGVRWDRARVSQVLQIDGKVQGVQAGDRKWSAQQVVIASGAWSVDVQGIPAQSPPVRPRRGQIVAWNADAPADFPIILDRSNYLVARADGKMLAGATDEDAGFDVGVTDAARADLTRFARRWCPDLLADEPAAQWAGLRSVGEAGSPAIGAHDTVEGLFVNTGLYRHGIVCAPAAAVRLAKLCAGQDKSLEI